MKTDRELLELAAKAAGIELQRWRDMPHKCYLLRPDFESGVGINWNPLTDDGDALRLAVKLGISISLGDVICAASATGAENHQVQLVDDDIYAATRRAIVRAAAAIGEGME